MNRPLLIVIALALSLLTIPACVSTGDIRAQLDQINDRLADEALHLADLEARIAALPPAGTGTADEEALRQALAAAVAESRLRAEAYRTAIANGELVLDQTGAAADSPFGEIAEMLPEPWRSLGLLGLGVAGAVWQRRRVMAAGVTIVKSLRMAKNEDPAMAKGFKENKALIAKEQAKDPLAVKMVEMGS